VYWRPWYSRPVFVTQVAVVNRGFHSPHAFPQRSAPSPAVRFQNQTSAQFVARQQATSRPSPAVQFQNHVARSSFQPQRFHPAPATHRAPVVQSHAGSPAPLSYHRPSGGSRGGQGGGHRGRS
jgi:hypothetical protein